MTRETRSNKLADGQDPVVLGAALRHELEVRGYAYQGHSTWVNSASGAKVTMGYSGGEHRLRLYAPGQVAGPPVDLIDLRRVEEVDAADTALAAWEFDCVTPRARRVA